MLAEKYEGAVWCCQVACHRWELLMRRDQLAVPFNFPIIRIIRRYLLMPGPRAVPRRKSRCPTMLRVVRVSGSIR
ncbi:hypothetical protein SERLA73DRAFT_174344 [Serpula lacrymans var. lacrymans S7.3]|uniref:Uncharacterized protein n=1 Tax=Serpula lacrymans var. lacrymans (strain S7.3) TaxID=936435 RepID=F8PFI3_SERL3|nr:hypothetical protein SERLA73DRAFT_174344 [Serpula lacrymans var. lacrymans S7.3]